MIKRREPSCDLNHETQRRELTSKGLPPRKCPGCSWVIYPRPYDLDEEDPPLTEEQIAYIKERLKNDDN